MGATRLRLLALLAALLVVVAGHAAGADPAAQDSAPSWTWAEVRTEWATIRAAAPVLPGLTSTPGGDSRLYVTETSSERPWTWCLSGPPCQLILVALPPANWQQNLWHEAGHVLHYLYPQDWATYRQQRGIPIWWQGPPWETWAEDFRRCYGPADQADHSYWWVIGEPAAPFCNWMRDQLQPGRATGLPQPEHLPG